MAIENLLLQIKTILSTETSVFWIILCGVINVSGFFFFETLTFYNYTSGNIIQLRRRLISVDSLTVKEYYKKNVCNKTNSEISSLILLPDLITLFPNSQQGRVDNQIWDNGFWFNEGKINDLALWKRSTLVLYTEHKCLLMSASVINKLSNKLMGETSG